MNRFPSGAALSLISALAMAGCTSGPAGDPGQNAPAIKLGVEVPLSGEDASDGTGALNGVKLAIAEAGRVCGARTHTSACFRLQTASLDDSAAGIHDPAVGAKNMQALAADPLVAGVIGPLYDSLARSELPIANASHLAMISPANTDECLTQEPGDGHCQGLAERLRPHGPNNYFRVVTTEPVEGAAAADLVVKVLGKRRPLIVYEGTPYGQEVATSFATQFVGDGGFASTIPPPQTINPADARNLGPLVERARILGADVIYFAGSNIDLAAHLRLEMAARIPSVPLVAADPLANDQYAKLAGSAARGTYYTLVGPYAPKLPEAQAFRRSYQGAYGKDLGRFSLPAFDAARILIRAISRAIDDAGGKSPDRDQVLAEVSRTHNFQGAMGLMSFDSRGDTSLKTVTAYEWMAAAELSGRFTAQLTVR